MITLDDIKRDLLMGHPTFVCPISGEILDYRSVHLVRFKHRGIFKTDVISLSGYNSLTDAQKDKLELTIINSIEGL